MTWDHQTQRMQQFELACRARGLPVTSQRRVVLDVVLGCKSHPTADEIYDEVKQRLRSISRTTVYRILDLLVEMNVIRRICHPGSAARFDPDLQRHHHLVCSQCERIIDVQDVRLDQLVWPDVSRHAFEIQDYQVFFRGICANCRKQSAARGRGCFDKAPATSPAQVKRPRSRNKRRKPK